MRLHQLVPASALTPSPAGRSLVGAQRQLDTLAAQLLADGVPATDLAHLLEEPSRTLAEAVVGPRDAGGPRLTEGQGQGYLVTQHGSSLRDDARALLEAVGADSDLTSDLAYLPAGDGQRP